MNKDCKCWCEGPKLSKPVKICDESTKTGGKGTATGTKTGTDTKTDGKAKTDGKGGKKTREVRVDRGKDKHSLQSFFHSDRKC